MRETQFINQNKEKWEAFEETLNDPKPDPDKLSGLLIQVTDDLSYSRTFYPNRSIRVYLNNLSQKVYSTIYKTKHSDKNGFVFFWKEDLPRLVYEARKELLFALAFFILSVAIGVFSSMKDPEFAAVILGDEYVRETLRNIDKGKPMDIYSSGASDEFFFMITLNNLRVAFTTFLLGVFACIGSIFFLMYNGIMVGAFQYFFIERDLFRESFLTIWLHGTLEISSIVIAAGAGITMGKGLIFPGTLSRLQSFLLSARRGLKILIGVVPIFVFAAFIEGFLTRYTQTPDAIRLSIIIFSFLFIVGYFAFYPYYKFKKGFVSSTANYKLSPSLSSNFNTTEIKSTGEHIKDLLLLIRLRGASLLKMSTVISVLFAILIVLFSSTLFVEVRDKDLFFITTLLTYKGQPLLALLNTLASSLMVHVTFNFFTETFTGKKEKLNRVKKISIFLNTFFILSLMHSFLFLHPFFAALMFCGFAPLFSLLLFSMYLNRGNLKDAISDSYTLMGASSFNVYYLFGVLLLNTVIVFLMLSTPLNSIFFSFIRWNLPFDEQLLEQANLFILVLINQFTFLILVPFLMFGTGLSYHSLKEIKDASSLTKQIEAIEGKK